MTGTRYRYLLSLRPLRPVYGRKVGASRGVNRVNVCKIVQTLFAPVLQDPTHQSERLAIAAGELAKILCNRYEPIMS